MNSVLIAFVIAIISSTQTTTVTGVVTNGPAKTVVVGAVVALEATGFSQTTTTDKGGKFTLVNVPAGAYHLTVRADGFLPTRSDFTVTPASPAIDVQLNTDPHFSEVVSVSPEARSQFDSYQPTSVLGGQDLAAKLQSTIGATLANEPGVAMRSFGPGPARPVIRGLDGDRVAVLQDGNRMGDLSSQSGDHGVNINPAGASTIEVVRGPATLLYGANAIGGLVNVITRNIPTARQDGMTGTMTFDAASAASEAGGAGDFTVGLGSMAFHASASARRSSDYSSPDGTIPNSFSRAGFGDVGLSFVREHGYIGGSVGYDRTHYGIPFVEEGVTNLNPRRQIVDLRAERRDLSGPFSSVRLSFGARRYRHDELDGEEVATSFKNDTNEFQALATHRPTGRLKGTLGIWGMTRTFSAEGEEALSPQVSQRGAAAFLYEEAELSSHLALQFGARVDHATFTPVSDFSARTFTNVSGSVGVLTHPTERTTIAVSVARASRNPALEELYFHGPHAGNNAVENGDDTLVSENALGVDLSFRFNTTRAVGEATVFFNRIDNFIFRQLTGEIDELPVTFFTQSNATLRGFESHIDAKLTDVLWLEGGLDSVHGQLTSLDAPLPRMPPLRGRIGLHVQRQALTAGFDLVAAAKQDRIFAVDGVGETPTAGYRTVKLFATYSFASGRTTNVLAVRLDNAGDTVYHNHLNYLKDLAPELGRDFRVTFTIKY